MRKEPGLSLYYQYNLTGATNFKSRKRISHSFVTGFSKLMLSVIGSCTVATTDTGNTSRNINGYVWRVDAGAGTDGYGLVVGTGTNAVDVTDYALQTQIDHGTGAGELQYSACTVAAPTFVGDTAELIITRLFTNASGGTITVEEIGAYVYVSVDASILSSNNVCIVRDLSNIEITNGTTLTLNYIIQNTL